jgi:hypothetical protein
VIDSSLLLFKELMKRINDQMLLDSIDSVFDAVVYVVVVVVAAAAAAAASVPLFGVRLIAGSIFEIVRLQWD